jgi:hypothetical protein
MIDMTTAATEVVDAAHTVAHLGLVDAYGHVSVRLSPAFRPDHARPRPVHRGRIRPGRAEAGRGHPPGRGPGRVLPAPGHLPHPERCRRHLPGPAQSRSRRVRTHRRTAPRARTGRLARNLRPGPFPASATALGHTRYRGGGNPGHPGRAPPPRQRSRHHRANSRSRRSPHVDPRHHLRHLATHKRNRTSETSAGRGSHRLAGNRERASSPTLGTSSSTRVTSRVDQ